MSTGTGLAVRDIEFSYGSLQVLFGVGLDVAPGEAVALLGTNGAGKSTLIRVITGLGCPLAGTVTFDGLDLLATPAEDMPGAGVVLVCGGKEIFPELTVRENLEMQAYALRRRHGWAQQRAGVVLDHFPRLRERLTQAAGSLSGGEQQQLALAKALMLDPRLLCIDELSLGLAPIIVHDLLEIVRGIHRSGVSIVLVEQSLNVAASLCERAVFMEKGQVRFQGATRELLERDDVARAVFLGGT